MRKLGIVSLVILAGYLSGKGAAEAASSRLGIFDSISPSNGNTTTTFPQNVTVSGTLTGTLTGNITGNAATATALAANPTDCSANSYAIAIDAGGNLTCATVGDAGLSTSYVKADGTRPATADWAVGGFGLTGVTHVDSNTASRASAGVLRLASTDAIDWRNNGNSANIALAKDTSDQLTYNGTAFLSSTPRLLAAAFPALTGDVTTSAGSVATSIAATTNSTLTTLSGLTSASSLATVGTITTGTWSATTIGTNKGGTGVTSVTTSPTASSFAGWDANKNLSANNFAAGYATTATAAGTTTLTNASAYYQYWTGTSTQTVKLPDATTLATGWTFMFVNNSSGNVTVQDNGGSTKQIMGASSYAWFTCTGTGSAAGTWQVEYLALTSGTVTSVGMTVPSFLSVSGSPVTTSGTLALSLSGTALPKTSGGTGSTTFPGDYYAVVYYPASGTNFWSTTSTTFAAMGPTGTIPSPSTHVNSNFGTISKATTDNAGINFSAPRTGVIRFVVTISNEMSGAINYGMQLFESTTSTVIASASAASTATPAFPAITLSGYFSATASTTYNFQIRGLTNTGTVYIASPSATSSDMLSFAMDYIN